MSEVWMIWALYPLIGAVSGLLAGLFGIGGGLVIVPALNLIFLNWVPLIPAENRMHFAIGTSLAVIVATSLSSLRAHQQRGAVLWPAFRRLIPGVLLGGLTGALVADLSSNRLLQVIFGTLIILISMYLILGYRPAASRALPGITGCSMAGSVIGAISALAGIGGGVMTVPFLVWCATPMRIAVGTAAACTLPVALAGAAGFILMGPGSGHGPPASTGYVYWPAAAGIAFSSIFLAPVGAWLTHNLPVTRLKQGFAVLLILVGLRMLLA
ncbi:MAG: sulfite exporter TauE/SafE family protein [Gammaproteobacteria bacterium]